MTNRPSAVNNKCFAFPKASGSVDTFFFFFKLFYFSFCYLVGILHFCFYVGIFRDCYSPSGPCLLSHPVLRPCPWILSVLWICSLQLRWGLGSTWLPAVCLGP